MAKLLTAYTLTSGISTPIHLGLNPDQVQAVRLANESPYALQVTTPDYDVYWLPAWTEDVIQVESGNELSVVPTTILTNSALQAPPSTSLLVTVYDKSDTVPPGSWPVALARQSGIGYTGFLQPPLLGKSVQHGQPVTDTLSIVAAAGQTPYLYGFSFHTDNPATTLAVMLSITGLASIGTLFYKIVESSTSGASYDNYFPIPLPGTVGGTISFVIPAATGGAGYSATIMGTAI